MVVLKQRVPVGLATEMVSFGWLPGKPPHPVGVGSGTVPNGSACWTVNGCSTVPVDQCVLAGIPPTAAIGLAPTLELPVATAAVIEGELVIIPQPRLTLVLPVASIPVTAWSSRLMTQYSPDGTMVAVALALIVGGADMNMPEKDSCR